MWSRASFKISSKSVDFQCTWICGGRAAGPYIGCSVLCNTERSKRLKRLLSADDIFSFCQSTHPQYLCIICRCFCDSPCTNAISAKTRDMTNELIALALHHVVYIHIHTSIHIAGFHTYIHVYIYIYVHGFPKPRPQGFLWRETWECEELILFSRTDVLSVFWRALYQISKDGWFAKTTCLIFRFCREWTSMPSIQAYT